MCFLPLFSLLGSSSVSQLFFVMSIRAMTSTFMLVCHKMKEIWSADKKTSLFSAHFDAKQCRGSFQQPHCCDPSPVLFSVGFQSSSIHSLLLDLDPYGRNDSDGTFPHIYKQVARELAHMLAVIFKCLVKGG